MGKNTVRGDITAGGDIHIGDKIYNIAADFKSGSLLFLRLDKIGGNQYSANLSVKSKHSTKGTLATSGEKWCENFEVNIPPQLFKDADDFRAGRCSTEAITRKTFVPPNDARSIQAIEDKLAQKIFDTFFKGAIGKACKGFIQLLEEQRIDELLLVISTDDETLSNLPFEMVLPSLFPSKGGQPKKSLALNNFGLVRTKIAILSTFEMQGNHAKAAPLKMLFISALPENLDESDKMLLIEQEQARLIQSVGPLEATGDSKPKIVVEFLDNASLNELNEALRKRQHDIVHISGHGDYDKAERKGVLYFENESGDEEKVTGKELGETLRQHQCVKLLVLSACETAKAGGEGGVTEQLAAFGVPGIVAMRFAVTDEGARMFTTEFYTQLAKPLSLTRALAYAREELHKDIKQHRKQTPQLQRIAEWFTPVVYQNQSLGALIDEKKPYHLPDDFYRHSTFVKTEHSRLIGDGFIGRKRYLIQMRKAFRAGRHVCLQGLGGLGKTTLAEAFADNYDNGSHTTIIFRNANEINEKYILDELLQRLEDAGEVKSKIRNLKTQSDDPKIKVLDKLQLLIANYLSGRKTILIFDNAEDVQKGEGESRIGSKGLSDFLKYLCEKAPQNCHILFTTRYKIEDLKDVLEHLPLDKMSYAEQYRLLNYSPILRKIPFEEREEVYKRLDGHPRGYKYLEVLLEKDETFTWQQVAQSEEKVFEDLLLAEVYKRLTERQKAIFQMLSAFITRTPLAALAAVSGEEEADLLPVLQSLQDWSLCFLEKNGRFEVHRLTREWMKKKEISPQKLKEWVLKAGEYFAAQPTWEDEILAKDYFGIAEAWQLFAATSFKIQGFYQHIGLYRQAIDLNQAVFDKKIDRKTNADALNYKGMADFSLGQYATALDYLKKSLAISQEIGDRSGEGRTLNNISQIYKVRGDYDTALGYLKKSLAIMQEIGDRSGEGVTLNNISQIYDAGGDYATALGYLEQSLAIQQEIGDRKGEGATLNNISQIYKVRGDYDTALGYLKKSLAIMQEIGDRSGEGTTLNNISQIYAAKGDYDTALGYLAQSLAISQQIGDRKDEGTTLNNLANIARPFTFK
ncbi:MAG: tetratricopeptide repeat protein [Chitinophagales bacterium]|nr:tetratricopeptide repeat protein [Chitinophagales bacterium]